MSSVVFDGGLPTLIPSKRTKTIRKKILEKAGRRFWERQEEDSGKGRKE
jgi:hypothetical protein